MDVAGNREALTRLEASRSGAVLVADFHATLVGDDRRYSLLGGPGEVAVGNFNEIPVDRLRRLIVETTDPRLPLIVLSCDPERGERIRYSLRRLQQQHVEVEGPSARQTMTGAYFEARQVDGLPVRLWLQPNLPPHLAIGDLTVGELARRSWR